MHRLIRLSLALALLPWLATGAAVRAADVAGASVKSSAAENSTVAAPAKAAAAPAPNGPSPAAPADSSTPGASKATADAAAASPVGEVKPEVFYVRDKDGRLVPVPGFSYEDFIRYYRLKQQLDRPETAPHYSLPQLTITGQTVGDRAELTAVFKVLVTTADWVRVPLRMNKLVLRQPEQHTGGGEEFLQFDPAGDGYVCWLRAPAGSEHEITLNLLASLTGNVGEERLDLSLPRASASQLRLHVPLAAPTATASPGSAVPEVQAAGKEASDISLLGLGGESWIAWRAADQAAARLSGALEATGLISVRIDGRSVNTDATLTVRSFGAEFDHFHVHLPPGSELVGGRQSGYTLSPGQGADGGDVEVRLDRKTSGPVEVRLLTERAYDVTRPNENLELSGFAVAEAIPHRQWGYVAVSVVGDWQLVWGTQTRIRQVGELPEALRHKDLTAGFEYLGQPSSLLVRVAPRKTRVSVEPQYLYEVRGNEIALEARLKYSIRGARLFKLDVDVAGWEIDSVGPDELIDHNATGAGDAATLSVPLAQPSSDSFELTFRAHQRVPPAAKSLEWKLPQPRADVVGPAEVTIVPASNVELTPQTDKMVGFSRATAPAAQLPSLAALPWHEPPLFYRGEQAGAKFAAALTLHPQEVSVDADQQILVGYRDSTIQESLTYEIRYAPLERLQLDLPRDLYEQRQLKFAVGQDSVEPRAIGNPTSDGRVHVELTLPHPVLGALTLEIGYVLARDRLAPGQSTALDVPLVVPVDGRLAANGVTVKADAGIRVDVRGEAWAAAPGSSNRATNEPLRLTIADAAKVLPLAVSLEEHRLLGATWIDRAWVQTWLTKTARQDRVSYHLTSSAGQLHVTLPEGVLPSEVELTLDGKPLSPVTGPQGELVVPLSNDAVRREHWLELRYLFDDHVPQNGRMSLEAPRFEDSVKIRHCYWQLLLPTDENLAWASGDLMPEYDWAWRPHFLGFERVSRKQERQLEQWLGAGESADSAAESSAVESSATMGLPDHANQYLFSTLGNQARFGVVVVRRWLLLLSASLATLAAGLALIYFPALRRPRALAAIAVALLLAAMIYPDLALLVAQAASFGFALALVAVALRHLVGREKAAPLAPASQSGFRLERSSTRSAFRPAEDVEPATTAAVSLSVDGPADEPNS